MTFLVDILDRNMGVDTFLFQSCGYNPHCCAHHSSAQNYWQMVRKCRISFDKIHFGLTPDYSTLTYLLKFCIDFS